MYPLPPENLQRKINIGDFRAIGQGFLCHFIKAGLRPDDIILEVGCGCGRMAIPLAEGFLGTAGRYTGFDIMPAVVEWCQQTITDPRFTFDCVNLRNGEYRPDGVGDAAGHRFPYADGSFDFVLVVSVFTHVLPEVHDRYLREIRRVLRPGRRAFLTYFIPPTAGLWRHQRGEALVANDAYPEQAVGYLEETLRARLTDCGLLIDALQYGAWAGRENPLDYQDLVTVRRPSSD